MKRKNHVLCILFISAFLVFAFSTTAFANENMTLDSKITKDFKIYNSIKEVEAETDESKVENVSAKILIAEPYFVRSLTKPNLVQIGVV